MVDPIPYNFKIRTKTYYRRFVYHIFKGVKLPLLATGGGGIITCKLPRLDKILLLHVNHQAARRQNLTCFSYNKKKLVRDLYGTMKSPLPLVMFMKNVGLYSLHSTEKVHKILPQKNLPHVEGNIYIYI